MKIELYPLKKVVIDGVAISFGMEQSLVEREIGKGQCIGNRCYYYDNEMAIDYHNNKVVFIEFLGGVDGILKPTIYGYSAFESNAEELLDVLRIQNNGEIKDMEQGYSYQFQNISVGLYREEIPQEISDMIVEAAKFGMPLSEEEITYEMKRATHWATIGVGREDYY